MGKSPGKWIKTVFFGKKHSKSISSNNATAPDKKASTKIRGDDNSPVVSDPSQLAQYSAENIELEKGTSIDSSTVDRGSEVQCKFVSVSLSNEEMRSQCEATTKVQAVFRGYLARRAFRALNGIIRLQALIRGRLVRRQAVATLHCMQAILKLQALARGQMVDIGENSIFESGKLATNAYVRKLLLSLPAVMPLSLQYNLDESNATWNWLKRWSSSRFWDQPTRSRKVSNVKPHIKKIGSQNVEAEPGKSKRTSRRASMGDIGPLSSFETDKPKRNPKKVQTELVQEQAQSELERVKLSLRKVSAPLTSAPANLETDDEKLDNVSEGKNVISAKHHVSEGKTEISAENSISEGQIVIPDGNHAGSDVLVDRVDFLEYGGKNENTRFSGDELSSRKDEKLNHKDNGSVIRKRRSLPEYSENISLKPPRLPSYMMATESAKAKLRLSQVSSVELISEDDGMKVGYVRRHSLPALTDVKTSSLSPMVQNRVHATNGKVGNGKSNRSMASCKDDKVLLPGWRR